ncbi:MAG: helix-turn-helix transcriptional regulator [Clostridia bacterium]
MDIKEVVGKRLKESRQILNLTQKEVAEKLGVSQPQYQRFENGIYECNYEQLVMLAKLLDVSADYLLGITDY